MLGAKWVIVWVLFWCILSITLCELVLCLAFGTTDEVAHLSYGFTVKRVVFLVADDASYLLGVHVYLASRIETPQAAAIIDEF